MNKKVIIISGMILIIAAFFAGKTIGSTHPATKTAQTAFMNGANGGFIGGRTGRTSFGGGTMGQVVSMDSNSITISIPGTQTGQTGGSKIILFSPSTSILKTSAGTASDISIGSTITATGTPNSDGSITASSIQIRPSGNLLKQGINPGGPKMPASQ
ncbi:MAG TPA: hypothetical protein VL576_01055 [Candidatus Paceibacterota bacterium]|jgi:hypothetical protein|nr:hypothetical protein [Candidatus Paceibacterota bacterium]